MASCVHSTPVTPSNLKVPNPHRLRERERERERGGEKRVMLQPIDGATRSVGDLTSHGGEKVGDPHKARWSHMKGGKLSRTCPSQQHHHGHPWWLGSKLATTT